ncbi:MAG TPA: enoyl-CoA hydratase/isomerase family protein [Ilumatobacter sp.]|nr:enoyl-CoA hydratase/isomerase family protein [Ilumatobacter sp.]
MLKDLTTLDFEILDRVATIRLNRPEAANGFNLTMASELATVAQHCDLNSNVKAVLLSGNGRFFSAGGDVKAMAGAGSNVGQEVKRMADELHRAISTFQRMNAPLVVAVNGTCAGAGFSLALTGDIVVAASSAKFTMAYTSIGLSPDGGSTYFLPRLVGLRKAQELMFTNRTLTSEEALDWGLISAVVGDADLPTAAADMAAKLANGSLMANSAVKELLLTTFANPLETQMELEGRRIAAAAASPNGHEGIRAFVQKRPARFE